MTSPSLKFSKAKIIYDNFFINQPIFKLITKYWWENILPSIKQINIIPENSFSDVSFNTIDDFHNIYQLHAISELSVVYKIIQTHLLNLRSGKQQQQQQHGGVLVVTL